MKLIASSLALVLLTTSAHAFDIASTTLDDLSAYIRAGYAAYQCDGVTVTQEEADLLQQRADEIAAHLKLSIDDYDMKYDHPVYDAIAADHDGFCAAEEGKVLDLIAKAK